MAEAQKEQQKTLVREQQGSVTPLTDQMVKTWSEEMGVPVQTIHEIKSYSAAGWATGQGGQPRQLNQHEMRLVALACHRTGLSLAGGHILFLGNRLYITKSGKIAVATRDEKSPLAEVVVRPATNEERAAFGVHYSDPEKEKEYEHLWIAEAFAWHGEERVRVGSSYGHACYKNINLKGKDGDTRRLCAHMAETRAVGRALSQHYDFFGLDSYEEVAQMFRREGFEDPPESLKQPPPPVDLDMSEGDASTHQGYQPEAVDEETGEILPPEEAGDDGPLDEAEERAALIGKIKVLMGARDVPAKEKARLEKAIIPDSQAAIDMLVTWYDYLKGRPERNGVHAPAENSSHDIFKS